MPLQEMQRRVANSLQIIAGILLRKARTVQSEDTRLHLIDNVVYVAVETGWRLEVSDNGTGTSDGCLNSGKMTTGLGTIIVEALAKQLNARVEVVRSPRGTTVSIAHAP
jgi:chemotaxis protein methyltransferase CheR